MNPSGDFAVAWEAISLDGDSSSAIGARRYNAAGTAQGGEFLVNTYTTGNQRFPAAAMKADGDFVIVWESVGGQDGNGIGVFGQQYSAAGAPQGGEFQVNSYTTFEQERAGVAMDADGDFVVVWHSRLQGGLALEIAG
jgi:hypothetical protein